jgi:hypothetical protein
VFSQFTSFLDLIHFRLEQVEGVGSLGVQGYRDLGVQGYRDLGMQGYRDLGMQGYRDLGVQGYTGLKIQMVMGAVAPRWTQARLTRERANMMRLAFGPLGGAQISLRAPRGH